MSNEFNFDNGNQDFGRIVIQEVLKTDYGPNSSFNGIAGHGPQNHHGGQHEQVNLFQKGIKGSGATFRIYEEK